MYIPPHFKEDDFEAALAIIRSDPFGMLVSVRDGEPFVTHIPFSVERSRPQLVLSAHVARANPHWDLLEGSRVTAIFRGVHGYISPRWYHDPSNEVPTWNYVAIHCSGVAALAAQSEKGEVLTRLVNEMERGAPQPWTVGGMDAERREAMLKNIVAFRIRVERVQAKFKLSQNRSAADFAGTLAGLRASGRPQDLELANAMESRGA